MLRRLSQVHEESLMKALVVSTPGTWSVVDTAPVPGPRAGEVLVQVKAVGICGSDLHILAGEFPPTPYPITPGHEFAGVVSEVGAGVANVSVGDRVAVDPSLFCGRCRYCRAGRGNLCDDWGAIGDTVDGAFAEYVVAPARNVYRLADALSFAAGALVEPMSCVVHGLHRLAMRPGSDLLIVGAGTIGLSLLQAARQSGATVVDVVDTDRSRLDRALAFGARHVASDTAELVARRGYGYEYVIEATGVAAAGQAALDSLDRGGSLLFFGVAPESSRISVSPFRVYNDEQTILGTMAVLNSFAPAMSMLAGGVIDAERMVTHSFRLEQFDEALATMRDRQGLKVQFSFE
jgi:2-desacetyl-2-hydroxyethyl bacteriochlorophyllide A dehydrogenase